jgi:6-phosphogluconolactonase (cycloisomerase 2 family)
MMEMHASGHLYLQTNEKQNQVIHYVRGEDGTLTEVERCPTGGSGSGAFNYRADPRAIILEGAQRLVLAPDRRLLFAVNNFDNSVSSFAVGEEGKLTLLDVKPTGNVVSGMTGTAKSLAYSSSSGTLYVLHTIGPDHIRLISVDSQGMLSARPEAYTAVPPDKPARITTMLTLAPDERFLLVGSSIDEAPAANPDGSPVLSVQRNGMPHSIFSNAPDPDGLAVFSVDRDGALGEPVFQDSGGSSPWCPLFLNHRPRQFVIALATADSVSLATLEPDGKVTPGPAVQADRSKGFGFPCWMSMTPDDRLVFATMTGHSYITSWRLEGNALYVARDPACPEVPGDGTFRDLGGAVGSGPIDMWMTPDGAYLYQIYPNASKVIGYAVQSDGELIEVASADIPYNSAHSLAGF